MSMETVTSADGTPIAFKRTGSGPPLVLVHGMAGNRTRWELFDVRSKLAERTTVYAMDRRGHGQSGDTEEYALEREFEDVAAVVDAIDESVHLLGHSHGGLCVLEAALRTDNLRSLIIYEPAGPWEEGHLYSEEMYEELEALVENGENEQALLVFLREVVNLPESQIDDLRAAPNWSARVDEAPTLPREYRAPVSYEFVPERFADMTTPTLLLVGGESPQWGKDMTEELREALPNSRISVLEGQGHLAMNTAPELFIDEVLTFIRDPGTEAMTENERLARSVPEDIAAEGNLDLIDEVFAEDAVEHGPLLQEARGVDEIRAGLKRFRNAFPDFKATVEDAVTQGDTVAMRVTIQGTHKGEFMGWEPTNNSFEIGVMVFTRIEDNKIVERWVQPDTLSMLQQLGFVTVHGQTSPET